MASSAVAVSDLYLFDGDDYEPPRGWVVELAETKDAAKRRAEDTSASPFEMLFRVARAYSRLRRWEKVHRGRGRIAGAQATSKVQAEAPSDDPGPQPSPEETRRSGGEH